MWVFVKIVLFAVLVDAAKIGKDPLVVYIDTVQKQNQDDLSLVEYSEEKLFAYKTIFRVLMNALHIEVNEQGHLEKTLRSALKNRCLRLKSCKKSCARSKTGKIQCRDECEHEIDEENICGEEEEVKAPKQDECKVDNPELDTDTCKVEEVEEPVTEKVEIKVEEKKDEVDECASEPDDKKDECKFRAQFRAKKATKQTKKMKSKAHHHRISKHKV